MELKVDKQLLRLFDVSMRQDRLDRALHLISGCAPNSLSLPAYFVIASPIFAPLGSISLGKGNTEACEISRAFPQIVDSILNTQQHSDATMKPGLIGGYALCQSSAVIAKPLPCLPCRSVHTCTQKNLGATQRAGQFPVV
jgi:hypothetical protein